MKDVEQKFINAIGQLDEADSMEYGKALLQQGYQTCQIIDLLNQGVKVVGDRFASGEYFIGDLIVSGMLYRSVIGLCSCPGEGRISRPVGRIVIGVAQDDIHDIGKDIVVSFLRAEGFEVIDLGVDVKPERFLHAVETYCPDVLLMSGLMSCTLTYMKQVVTELEKRGLRDTIAVMVGGSVVDEHTKSYVGVDAAAKDPAETVAFCKKNVGKKR